MAASVEMGWSSEGHPMATAEKPTPLGPGYWRDRAREAWTLAARVHDLEAKSTMIRIAKGYGRLAGRARVLNGETTTWRSRLRNAIIEDQPT